MSMLGLTLYVATDRIFGQACESSARVSCLGLWSISGLSLFVVTLTGFLVRPVNPQPGFLARVFGHSHCVLLLVFPEDVSRVPQLLCPNPFLRQSWSLERHVLQLALSLYLKYEPLAM